MTQVPRHNDWRRWGDLSRSVEHVPDASLGLIVATSTMGELM